MRAVSRYRLIVPLLLVAAVTGCSSAPSGSASAVVTYVDESGEQRVEVATEGARCDEAEPRRLGSPDEEIVFVVAATGEATFRVRLGDELSFLSKGTASATQGGIQVDGVTGTVVRSGISGTQTRVSAEATLSGTVVCPES